MGKVGRRDGKNLQVVVFRTVRSRPSRSLRRPHRSAGACRAVRVVGKKLVLQCSIQPAGCPLRSEAQQSFRWGRRLLRIIPPHERQHLRHTFSRSPTSANPTARRSAASSTAARPAWRSREADIQGDLDRRRPGTSRHVTQRNEPDAVQILSRRVRGQDHRHADRAADPEHRPAQQGLRPDRAAVPARPCRLHLLEEVRHSRPARRRALVGPAHGADGRGRRGRQEVAAGEARHGVSRLHDADRRHRDPVREPGSTCRTTRSSRRSPTCRSSRPTWTRCARPATPAARASASTASGVPVGLGEPLFDKMDADIAYAMMGINAVKGVEIGAGFASVTQRGTTHGDSITPRGLRNQQRGRHAGRHQHRAGPGSVASRSSRPAPSSARAQSIDVNDQPVEVVTKGRHDPCVGIRATPIAEAMLALVVMEHALRHRAQCGDVRTEPPPAAPTSAPQAPSCSGGAAGAAAGRGQLVAVRGAVGQLLRAHRLLQSVPAALAEGPGLADLHDQPADLGAVGHARLRALCLGRAAATAPGERVQLLRFSAGGRAGRFVRPVVERRPLVARRWCCC